MIISKPSVMPGHPLIGPRRETYIVTDVKSVEEFFAAFADADEKVQPVTLNGSAQAYVKYHTSEGTKVYHAHHIPTGTK